MFSAEQIRLDKLDFRHIYVVENDTLCNITNICNWQTDLVLCTDFGLFHKLKKEGYTVAFLDHLIDNHALEALNLEMHHFLKSWYRDENGHDLLHYEGYDIGDALLLNVLNEITYFCHFFFNLLAIKVLKYDRLFLAAEEPLIGEICNLIGLHHTHIPLETKKDIPIFSFPITKWMNEKIGRTSLKHRFKDTATIFIDYFLETFDLLKPKRKNQIFIHNYFPTSAIVSRLLQKEDLQLIFSDYIGLKNILKQKRIIYKKSNSSVEAAALIDKFKRSKKSQWKYSDYIISDYLYQRLLPIVETGLERAISSIKSINAFFAKHPIQLMVPITNLWLENRLIMNYCRNHQIPVFMIINGLLNNSFYEDAHDSDWVNCYSESVKCHYFKNASKAIALGDPRLDSYVLTPNKKIDRTNPTIVIGTAGFDLTDLNSYLAYEFDFLYDIISTIERLKSMDYHANIILKVRANGYVPLYKSFIETYFPKTDIQIFQNKPFKEVIAKADLYISFYSQTIFEASLLGIPAIYYKKDTQFLHSPFDEKSELVTAKNTTQLQEKILSFYSKESTYNLFLDTTVLEKYIGFVDGKNAERNTTYIYKLLNKQNLSQNQPHGSEEYAEKTVSSQ